MSPKSPKLYNNFSVLLFYCGHFQKTLSSGHLVGLVVKKHAIYWDNFFPSPVPAVLLFHDFPYYSSASSPTVPAEDIILLKQVIKTSYQDCCFCSSHCQLRSLAPLLKCWTKSYLNLFGRMKWMKIWNSLCPKQRGRLNLPH